MAQSCMEWGTIRRSYPYISHGRGANNDAVHRGELGHGRRMRPLKSGIVSIMSSGVITFRDCAYLGSSVSMASFIRTRMLKKDERCSRGNRTEFAR